MNGGWLITYLLNRDEECSLFNNFDGALTTMYLYVQGTCIYKS